VNVHLACPTTLGAPKTISRGPRSLPTGITQAKNGRDGPREIAGATRPPSSCTDSCEAPVAKACELDLALSSVCLSKLHDAGVEDPAWGVEAELVHRGHQGVLGDRFCRSAWQESQSSVARPAINARGEWRPSVSRSPAFTRPQSKAGGIGAANQW
jgi:hypothetical protein